MTFDFEKTYVEIVGGLDLEGKASAPLEWQAELLRDWSEGRFRPVVLPPGNDRACVIVLWTLALARQASNGISAVTLPRRLVYTLDCRAVVDGATEMAEALLAWLEARPDHPVTRALASLSSGARENSGSVISVRTLLGRYADNDDWKRDPARPAIIVGNIRAIGNRLLFWGDGDGRAMRSLHAGLLGQDVLLVHEDADLSPAFGQLIRQVQDLQRGVPSLKPFRYVELTGRPLPDGERPLLLSDGDRSRPEVAQRLCADKTLVLQSLGNESKPADRRAAIVEKALSYVNASQTVLIYVSAFEDAVAIARELLKRARKCQTRVLTERLRGHERDELARSKLLKQFRRAAAIDRTRYLVSTAAGEVAAELDADIGIFDLCTIDRFVQRAARVNRTGGDERQACITVIHGGSDSTRTTKDKPSGVDGSALCKTLELLQRLPAKQMGAIAGFDASPKALSTLSSYPGYADALTPAPRTRKLEPHLLDTWAMTEPNPRIGPAVTPWLLGISDEPPQTTLVWRDLPKHSGNTAADFYAEWLAACPIRAAEKSTLPTDEAERFLEALSRRLGPFVTKTAIPVVNRRNTVVKIDLGEFQYNRTSLLSEAAVILPADWGGLSPQGIPDVSSAGQRVEDLSDADGERERWDLRRSEASWLATRGDHSIPLRAASFDDAVDELERERDLRTAWMDVRHGDADEELAGASARLYLGPRRPGLPDDDESGAQAAAPQSLQSHLDLTGRAARAIGAALGLDGALVDRLAAAGAAHDRGKDRSWWQQAAGNFSDKILAKGHGRSARWRRLGGYRHELGSLLELLDGGADDDLVLHLVASHHGRSRPGFEPQAFDNTHRLAMNEEAVFEAQLRFERLQRRYGWWGLAYLEALLKCADVMGTVDVEE